MKPLRRIKHTTRKDKNIYMPVKKNNLRQIRKPKFQIFKKKNSSISRKRNVHIPQLAIYVGLIAIFLAIAYLAVVYINKLRNREKIQEQTYIIGIENMPAYPNSSFIFANSMDLDSVKTFLASGSSGYRLPNGTNIDEVFEYYNEKLPTYGWTFVQMVSMESEDKEYGQYWTKENQGLRIYSKYNDVWYETISTTQAQSGLADRVALKTERELLLTDEDAQDLLPDFPWILPIPKEYILSYKVSIYNSSEQQLLMSKIGTNEKIYLTPIGKSGTKALDYFVDDYVAQLNTSSEEKWNVINTVVISTRWGTGLRGTIGTKSITDQIVVIPNTYNKLVYIIDSNVLQNPFVDYILEEIQPQSSKKY